MFGLPGSFPLWGFFSVSFLAAGCTQVPPVEISDSEEADMVTPSQSRPDIRGTHGAVSADHPLAAAAG
ncbi:MAG: hypothetical protein ABIF09_12155, partial [Gemmatimonadota bacterium]